MSLKKLKPYISKQSIVSKAPGRINLIGEHTDYNEGFVMPAAIDRAVFTSVIPRSDDEINLHSIDMKESYSTSVPALRVTKVRWANYILGVVAQFISAGIRMRGFDLYFTGDLPLGGGLSSSAAVECSVATALKEMLEAEVDKLQMARMCQLAEHTYAGVKCGIMDQFASLFGKKDKVIRLDCRSLDYEYLPLKLDGIKILLFDTNIKHSLANSEYNVRHQQCFNAVNMLAKVYPQVKTLRDATPEMIEEVLKPQNEILYIRSKYVVEENIRVEKACADLRKNNLNEFGRKMFQTHDGLSKLYDVSCHELDFLVDNLRDNKYVLGSRMMGGGFGGCTINLVKEEAAEELIIELKERYLENMKRELDVHDVKIDDGSSIIRHHTGEVFSEP